MDRGLAFLKGVSSLVMLVSQTEGFFVDGFVYVFVLFLLLENSVAVV